MSDYEIIGASELNNGNYEVIGASELNNGNYEAIGASELNNGNYEVVNENPIGDLSYTDALMRTLNYIPTSAARAASGIAGFASEGMAKAADYLGLDTIRDWNQETVDRAANVRDRLNAADEATRQRWGEGAQAEPGSGAYYLEQAGPAVSQIGATLLSGGTLGPVLAGAQSVGQEYSSLSDKGVEDGKLTTALGSGLLDALTSKFELSKVLKPGVSRIPRAVVTAVGEGLQEGATDTGTKALEEGFAGQDYTLDEYLQGLKDSAILGAASGGVTAGVLHPAIEARARKQALRGVNTDFGPQVGTIQTSQPEVVMPDGYIPQYRLENNVTIPDSPAAQGFDAQMAKDYAQKLLEHDPIGQRKEVILGEGPTVDPLSFEVPPTNVDAIVDPASPDAQIRQAQDYAQKLLEYQPGAERIGAIPLPGPTVDPTSFELTPTNPNAIVDPAAKAIQDSNALLATVKKSKVIESDNTTEFPKPIEQKVQETPTAEVKPIPVPQETQPVTPQVDTDFSNLESGLNRYKLYSQDPLADESVNLARDYMIPKEMVGANPELMQYKSGADSITGVVEELKGEYNPQAAKGMLFWEPIDKAKYGLKPGEEVLVVNGHHRRDLGNRSPEVTHFNGAILREADGISIDKARLIGAELNIIEGRGSVYDEAKFFREMSKLVGPSAASQRARELGVTGRTGASLGLRSSDELYHAFQTGRIPEQTAKAIADTSQRIEAEGELKKSLSDYAQSVALQAYKQSLVPDKKGNVHELTPDQVAQIAMGLIDDNTHGTQEGFSFAKPTAYDIAVMTEKANLITKDRKALINELSGIKRDKKLNNISEEQRTELLSKGQDVSKILDESIVSENQKRIENKLLQLDKLKLFPEVDKTYTNKAKEKIGKIGFQTSLLDQSGTAPIIMEPARFVSDTAKAVGESIANLIGSRNIDIEQSPIDKQFGSIWGRAKKQFSTLEEVAKEHKDVEPIVRTRQASTQMVQRKAEILHDSSKKLKKLATLDANEKVKAQAMMHAIRRESDARIKNAQITGNVQDAELNITEDELVKRGLSPEGAKAVLETFDYMNTHAVAYIYEGLKAEADLISYETRPSEATLKLAESGDKDAKLKVQDWIDKKQKLYAEAYTNAMNLREWNGVKRWYIPFAREGDYYVHATDAEGKTKAFHLVDGTTSKIGKALGGNSEIARLKKQYESQGYNVEYGKRQKTQQSAYDDLPPAISRQIKIGDKPKLDPRGFSEHLIDAKLTEGEGTDIEGDIVKYVYSLSNFAAKNKARLEFKKAMDIAGDKASYRDWLSATQGEYLANKPNKTRNLEQMVTLYNLGYKMALPVQSLTQMITTTTAKFGIKNSMLATKRAGEFFTSPDFADRNPQLAQHLAEMRRQGALEANAFGEYSPQTDTSIGKAVDMSLFAFKKAEEFTKVHAAISAYLDARAKHIAPDQIYQYMKDGTKETQFGTTNIDRPLIATKSGALGELGPLAMMYRSWGMNYYRFLRNNAAKGAEGKKVAAKSMAYTFGLAGLTGVPLAKSVMHYLASLGYDEQKELRDIAGDEVGTFLLYGATPYITEKLGLPINLSGSLGLSGMAPEFGDNPLWNTAKFVGGAPLAFVENMTTKPYKSYMEGNPIIPTKENPRSAVESMLPEFIRRPVVAIRESKEGWRNPDGSPVGGGENFRPHQPTLGEGIAYSLGVMPAEKAKLYEKQQSIWAAQKRARGTGINDVVAEKFYDMYTGKVSRETVAKFVQDYKNEQMKLPPEKRKDIREVDVIKGLLKRFGVPVNAPKSARKDIADIMRVYSSE